MKHLCWNHTCECCIRNHCARHAKAALGYKPHYGTYMAFWRYCRNARAPISLLFQRSLRSTLLVARHLLRCFRCHSLTFQRNFYRTKMKRSLHFINVKNFFRSLSVDSRNNNKIDPHLRHATYFLHHPAVGPFDFENTDCAPDWWVRCFQNAAPSNRCACQVLVEIA